jgi:hypothetical protein
VLGSELEALAQQSANRGFGGSRKRAAFRAAQRQKPFVDHQNLHLTNGHIGKPGLDVAIEQVRVMLPIENSRSGAFGTANR